mgnify:CR=1 FL=1
MIQRAIQRVGTTHHENKNTTESKGVDEGITVEKRFRGQRHEKQKQKPLNQTHTKTNKTQNKTTKTARFVLRIVRCLA